MTKRKQITVAFLASALGGIICVVVWPREPVFHGRSLTEWLVQQSGEVIINPIGATNKLAREVAEEAIRQIGGAGIPTLLKLGQRKDSLMKQRLVAFLQDRVPDRYVPFIDADYAELAEEGFRVLGPLAKPAVPELVALLSDRRPEVRVFSASALGAIGTSAEGSVESLLRNLNDQDYVVQRVVRRSLGLIGGKPDLVVPALIQSLQGTNKSDSTASYALGALAHYGDAARLAAPTVAQLLSDNYRVTRYWATNALKAISPETVDKVQSE